MKIFHIIGQPAAGKTTLVADLVKNLTGRGVSVGTIKHTSHSHELDKPGKDTFIHRKAGAAPAAIITQDLCAVYMPRKKALTPEDLLNKFYAHLDMVLIEGWISGPYEKIEIWQEPLNKPPLFTGVSNVIAITSDTPLPTEVKQLADRTDISVFKRHPVAALADYLTDRQSPGILSASY